MEHFPRDITPTEIRDLVGDAPVIVEVGANDGRDTQTWLTAMPGAKVFCFEPDPRPIERFEARGFDDRVELLRFAVGSEDGFQSFHQSGGYIGTVGDYTGEWDQSGSLREPTGHKKRSPEITFPRTIEVPVCRLDTWLDQTPHVHKIDFLWADVQGAQRDVIAGAEMTLDITHWLYIECHEWHAGPLYDCEPTFTELCDLLPDFRAVAHYGDNYLFENRTHDAD